MKVCLFILAGFANVCCGAVFSNLDGKFSTLNPSVTETDKRKYLGYYLSQYPTSPGILNSIPPTPTPPSFPAKDLSLSVELFNVKEISPAAAESSDSDILLVPRPFAPTVNPDVVFETPASGSKLGLPTGWVSVAQPFPQQDATQCSCVTAGTCITIRIVTQNNGVTCPAGQQYCCTQGSPNLPQTDTCGLPNIVAGVTPTAGQADFGQYPWSGILMNANTNQYVGGATLITTTHLLTAAHLVASYPNGAGLKVRLGEWDLAGTYEPVPYTESQVASVVVHPAFVPATLQNDLAVVTLATAIALLTPTTPQINIACLPAATDTFTGQGCFVAGWGRDSFNGNYQNIIKTVDVPIVDDAQCQNALRQTKLGPNWNLDTASFVCAGGELAKDACQGDGGNALVCVRNNRFVVAGITAAGVECGRQGVPGLYVKVSSYLPWIAQQTQVTNLPIGTLDPRRKG